MQVFVISGDGDHCGIVGTVLHLRNECFPALAVAGFLKCFSQTFVGCHTAGETGSDAPWLFAGALALLLANRRRRGR